MIIILSYVIIAQQISYEFKTEVAGSHNLVKNTAKNDLLSVDITSKADGSQCGVWSSLGFEIFQLLILGMLILLITNKLGRRICRKEGILAKRREAKLKIDAIKFAKLKQRFEKAEVVEPEKEKKEPTKELAVEIKRSCGGLETVCLRAVKGFVNPGKLILIEFTIFIITIHLFLPSNLHGVGMLTSSFAD